MLLAAALGSPVAPATGAVSARPLAQAVTSVGFVLECVIDKGATAPPETRYTAIMGYNNTSKDAAGNPISVTVPIGSQSGFQNRFNPAPQDRGQPTTFLPGRQVAVFSFDWPGSNVNWFLTTCTGVVGLAGSRCATPTPTPTTTPTATPLPSATAVPLVARVWLPLLWPPTEVAPPF